MYDHADSYKPLRNLGGDKRDSSSKKGADDTGP